MESNKELTYPELADLDMFLFDEGVIHYRRGDNRHAKTRFVQCLSVFQQMNKPNYSWIASLLYHLGNICLNEKQAQMAWDFLKSAAQIQGRADDDESGAKLLRDIGELATRLGKYTLAQKWFEASKKIYQNLELDEQTLGVQKQLDRANMLQDRYAYRSSPDEVVRSSVYQIKVHGQLTRKFSVSASGDIQWSLDGIKVDQDMDLGMDGWEVSC